MHISVASIPRKTDARRRLDKPYREDLIPENVRQVIDNGVAGIQDASAMFQVPDVRIPEVRIS